MKKDKCPQVEVEKNLSRRNFITGSLGALIGVMSFPTINWGTNSKRMKYVTLGRTKMKASKFLGDYMGERKMYEMALSAGVNYWHKMGSWRKPAPYDLFRKLDRDSFYCDTVIDSLEKEKAIEQFEKSLSTTGLKMIDGFKIHSLYRNAEDVKTKMGAVRAFEELKKRGKTRFLMLSQHINTVEVLEAAIESDLFDLIQIPVNPTVPQDYFTKEEFSKKATQDRYFNLIKKASDKGIAVTAMKVFLGGTKTWEQVSRLKNRVKSYLPDNKSIATALIHWALNVPGVLAFGNLLFNFDQLRENLEAVESELTDTEDQGLKVFAQLMGKRICRMCGNCQRLNPGGVAVSEIFRFKMYHSGYGMPNLGKSLYATLPKHEQVNPTVDLTPYEKACPYGLPVANLLKEAHALLT